MSNRQTEIRKEMRELDHERMDYMSKAMASFDAEQRIKRKALQDECAGIGHTRGRFHNNGLGWSWFYCSTCGGQMDIQGPDCQSDKDDEQC